MNRGIALAGDGGLLALARAVECFDRAIELRATLTGSDNPWFRYNLIGAWINRGDALARWGSSEKTSEAIDSYDKAIQIGERLDLDFHPAFRRRIALVHLNRGAVNLRMPGMASPRQACISYTASIETLACAKEADVLIAASAWAGKADALGSQGEHEDARSCALKAMGMVAALETYRRDAAVVGLTSRIALCASSCSGLHGNRPAFQETKSAEALEAAENGLQLARSWFPDGPIESLSRELFRFGALGYAAVQPHFLCEFIDEFLPLAGPESKAAWLVIAGQAVRDAIGRLMATGILSVGLEGDAMATFSELRFALARL